MIPFYKKYHFQKNEHVRTVMLGENFWQLEIILLAETKKNRGTQDFEFETVKADLRKKKKHKTKTSRKRYSLDNRACGRIYLNLYSALGKSAKFPDYIENTYS